MVQVKDIMSVMERIAPEKLAENWDRPGLAVGEPKREVKKILVALDVTGAVVEEAVALGADMIVTHHPMLLFQKLDRITADTPLGQKIFQLITHGIAAFSAHTNLDVVKGGTNDVLAERIGLQDVQILEETWKEPLKKIVIYVPLTHAEVVRDAMCRAGAGQIGRYACCTFGAEGIGTFLPLEGTNPYLGSAGKLEQAAELRLETIVPAPLTAQVLSEAIAAHPYEEVAYDIYPVEQTVRREGIGRIGSLPQELPFAVFAERLKTQLQLDRIRVTGDGQKRIRRVALCTGSGAEYLSLAHRMGADAYLTGDIKFHEAQKAVEAGLCVADVTHYASEVLIVPILQRKLQEAAEENGWALEVICSNVDGQTFWTL